MWSKGKATRQRRSAGSIFPRGEARRCSRWSNGCASSISERPNGTATKNAAALRNMYNSGPRGTTDWQRYEVTVDIPADATVIEFGMLLDGKGKAWFDDLEVTLDGVRYEPGGEFDFNFEQEHIVG